MKISNLIVFLLLKSSIALAVQCTFNPISNFNWSNTANWSCGHVPLATDDVVINTPVNLDIAAVMNKLDFSLPVLDNGSTMLGPGSLTVNGTFNMRANVGNTGGVTINGTLNWSNWFQGLGTVNCNGTTNIGPINSAGVSRMTVLLNGGGSWVGNDIRLWNGGILRIPLGVTLLHTGTNGNLIWVGGGIGETFDVRGTFSKITAGSINSGVPIDNSGTFSMGTGSIFNTGQVSTGIFNNSGILKGNGTINVYGGLIQTGSISPGNSVGKLTIDNLPSGTTNTYIELQGTATPGVDYDQIVITNGGVISGTLNISFLNGFVPTIGNQFIIMTCANGCTGNFSNIVHPGSNPNAWQIDRTNPNQIKLILAQKLPIHLVSFTATHTDDRVHLLWSTASESDKMGYFIDRKRNDDNNWKEIGFVSGQSLIKQAHYSYDDEKPLSGFNYYRLRQIDFDGQEEYSNIVKVEFTSSNNINDLVVAPNPVFAKTLVMIPEGGISLEVYDVLGRQVLFQDVRSVSSKYIDMERFQVGTYLLKVKTDTGFMSVQLLKK